MIAQQDTSIRYGTSSASPMRWHFHPDAESLRGVVTTMALDDWLKAGRAHIVKQGPHRIVYRLTIADATYYLKRHLVPDLRTRVRQWIRPTKAYMEYDRALRVARCGIATVRPAAWGQGERGESYLLTHGLDDVVPLSQFLTERLPTFDRRERVRWRLRLARELGRFVARIHGAGITHRDFHAGNVLLSVNGGRPELFLLDLDTAHLGRPLDERARQENLALFHLWFIARASRADRHRFLCAYFAQCGHLDPNREARKSADRLNAAAWNFARAFWRDRDERCTKSNRYYQCVRRGAVAGHALADFDPDVLAQFLADPEEPFRRPGVTVLKESRSSKVVSLELTVHGVRRAFVYKRFASKSVWKSLGHTLHTSPALHSWIQGHGFHERGLPTARPMLLLQQHRNGMIGDGYLLTEKIENAVNLHQFMNRLQTMPPDVRRARLRPALAALGKIVRMLHERHISHRDLKANNILLRDPEAHDSAAPASVWLIDLVGAHLGTSNAHIENLARLNASYHDDRTLTRTDRLRLLKAYFAVHPMEWVHWKSWWRRLEHVTERKIERNQRYGRDVG